MTTPGTLLEMTADIVSAYAGANNIVAADLPDLINAVHRALRECGEGTSAGLATPMPAVPVRKSVSPDHLICLEDGRKFKSLKRHLRIRYNMSPDEYRAKWGLPDDYPMVAPKYAKARSDFARTMGLGQKRNPAPRARRKPPEP